VPCSSVSLVLGFRVRVRVSLVLVVSGSSSLVGVYRHLVNELIKRSGYAHKNLWAV